VGYFYVEIDKADRRQAIFLTPASDKKYPWFEAG